MVMKCVVIFSTLLTLEEYAMLCFGSALIVACSTKMVIYARVSEYLDLVFCKIILSKSTKQTTSSKFNYYSVIDFYVLNLII